MMSTIDSMIVTHAECGFSGTIAAVQVHDCDIFRQGGRCEDYPCCGHTDGDGCQTLPSHTSEFYYRNPHLMYEPGSPEWEDALDDGREEYEAPQGMDNCKGCGADKPWDDFDGAAPSRDPSCIACRIRQHVNSEPQRRGNVWRWPLEIQPLNRGDHEDARN